jgi:hypothetical protein
LTLALIRCKQIEKTITEHVEDLNKGLAECKRLEGMNVARCSLSCGPLRSQSLRVASKDDEDSSRAGGSGGEGAGGGSSGGGVGWKIYAKDISAMDKQLEALNRRRVDTQLEALNRRRGGAIGLKYKHEGLQYKQQDLVVTLQVCIADYHEARKERDGLAESKQKSEVEAKNKEGDPSDLLVEANSSGSSGDAAFNKTLGEADKLLADLRVNRTRSTSLTKEQFIAVNTDVLKELEFEMLQIQQNIEVLLQQYQVHRLDAQSRMAVHRQINAATEMWIEEAIKTSSNKACMKHGVDRQTMKAFVDVNKLSLELDPVYLRQGKKMNNISQGKYDCETPEGLTKDTMLQYFQEKKECMDQIEKTMASMVYTGFSSSRPRVLVHGVYQPEKTLASNQAKEQAYRIKLLKACKSQHKCTQFAKLASYGMASNQAKEQAYRIKLSKAYKSQHECTQFAKLGLLTNAQHKPEVILNCALQRWVKDPEFLEKMKPYLGGAQSLSEPAAVFFGSRKAKASSLRGGSIEEVADSVRQRRRQLQAHDRHVSNVG